MERTNRRTALACVLGIVFAGAAAGRLAGEPLTPTRFEELHRALQPPAGEAWRTLPWHTSILEARAVAARERKPVYMLVRSGHPLGCV